MRRFYIFLLVILIGVLWDSWNCSLVSVTSFGKFTGTYLFCFVFFSLWYSNYMYVTPVVNEPQSQNSLFVIIIFLFAFHFGKFLLKYLRSHWWFPSCSFYWWVHQRHSSRFYSILCMLVYLLTLRVFIFLIKLSIYS